MIEAKSSSLLRSVEAACQQKDAEFAACPWAEVHPQRVGPIATVVVVFALSDHDAIGAERSWRNRQHMFVKHVFVLIGKAVRHGRGEPTKESIQVALKCSQGNPHSSAGPLGSIYGRRAGQKDSRSE